MDPLFVAIDGIDGSGTTTCSKLLAKTLSDRGIEVLWTKEPSDGAIGRHIKRILRGEDIAGEEGMFPLFLADRHDHIANVIKPSLEQENFVVCDRYGYSTWVYQQDSYDPFIIEYLHRYCLVPDIVFFLLCPVMECAARIGKREARERYEDVQKQIEYAARYKIVPRIRDERFVYLDSFNNRPDALVEQMLEEMGI